MSIVSKVDAVDLYPDPVRVFQAATSAGFNGRLIDKMRSCRTPHASKCRLSLLDGVRDETIEEMDAIFRQAFMAYVTELFEPALLENFDFFQDWSINVYANGTATLNHTHNEAVVTMTYYPTDTAAAPDKTFTTRLLSLKTGQLVMSRPGGTALWDRYGKAASRVHWQFTPRAGSLVVFPGYMPHWTVPGEPGTRYCLGAFVTCKARNAKPMELGL
jgi:hypothetical protein